MTASLFFARRPRLASTLAALPLLGFAVAAEAQQITVTSWGGAFQDAQRKAFFEPYTKKTGVKITEDQWSGELAKVKGMVQSGNTTWDVLDVDPKTAQQGCYDGVFEKLDYSRLIENKDELAEGGALDCAIGTSMYATVLAFDPAKVKKAPTDVTDIFNVKDFPGKRALQKGAADNLELALLAEGVPLTDVYKVLATQEGQDRAFKKLDTIKQDIVWWTAGAQPPQMLAAGEAVLSTAWNGRIADANKNGKSFTMIWSNAIRGFDMWVIPTGTKNLDLAYDFIKFATAPEAAATLPRYISYAPISKAAAEAVAPELQANLPTAPQNSKMFLVQDPNFWGDYGPDLEARFSTWLAS